MDLFDESVAENLEMPIRRRSQVLLGRYTRWRIFPKIFSSQGT